MTYHPTRRQENLDRSSFIIGSLLIGGATLIVLVLEVYSILIVAGAVVLYLVIGVRFAIRMLFIRSHLGPLNDSDLGYAYFWALGWWAAPGIILHDMHVIMDTPSERELVQSKGFVTRALEQTAAGSRWQLGDLEGHVRLPREDYPA